ncbi:MAG: nitroreductase family protein [Bacteroidales bacterium]|nr:nitroreductase family protein [Bacteroidales bacterium]
MHIKTASTDYPISNLLRERWSPRAFNSQPVEKEKLQRLFEAARWAPSSSNLQPWSFIIGFKGDDTYNKIAATLVEFNQLWALTAPMLLLAITKNTNQRGEPNRSALYDLGQSVAHLTFQATADGLFVHQMGGFDSKRTIELFEIPAECSVATAIAIGYIGNPDSLPDNLKKLETTPRERRQSIDLVFTGTFGQPTDIFNQ